MLGSPYSAVQTTATECAATPICETNNHGCDAIANQECYVEGLQHFCRCVPGYHKVLAELLEEMQQEAHAATLAPEVDKA